MAQTTGHINAQNVVILLGGQDISGSSNFVELAAERDIGRAPTFTGGYEVTTAGVRRWSGRMRILYTEIADEAMDEVWVAFEADTVKSLEVRPKGTGAPAWTWTGNVWITRVPIPFDKASADPIAVEATFEGDGALDHAAQT